MLDWAPTSIMVVASRTTPELVMRHAPNVTRELLKRGYSEEDLLIGSIALFGFSLAFRPAQTDDEPQTKVELGRQLFFDPILSSDRTISCSSCHKPEFAFADTSTGSRGVGGQSGDRNTPSAMNLTGRIHLFWDGRASSLEMQALQPIAASNEMNLPIVESDRRFGCSPVRSSAYHFQPL